MDFSNTLGIRLRHAYLKFHRCAQLALSDSEITADQFVLLNFLLGNTGVMQKDIVELIGSDSSTIGAMVKILEGNSLIKRIRDKNDGRAFCIYLTEKGHQVLLEQNKKVSSLRDTLVKAIPEDNLPIVLEALSSIDNAMSDLLKKYRAPV